MRLSRLARCTLCVLVPAAGVLTPRTVWCASAPLQDRAALVTNAAAVVHATVLSSTSHWNESHTLVVTDVRLGVHETLKGAPVKALVVRVPGGRIGKLRVEVPGCADFIPGRETVVALVRDARGTFYVAGLVLGRWDVETDGRGVKIARGAGVPAGRAGTSGRTAPAPAAAIDGAGSTENLSQLLQDLRGLVRAGAAAGGR